MQDLAREITKTLQLWGVGYPDVFVGFTCNVDKVREEHAIVGGNKRHFEFFTSKSWRDIAIARNVMHLRGCDVSEEHLSKTDTTIYVFVKTLTTVPSC